MKTSESIIENQENSAFTYPVYFQFWLQQMRILAILAWIYRTYQGIFLIAIILELFTYF